MLNNIDSSLNQTNEKHTNEFNEFLNENSLFWKFIDDRTFLSDDELVEMKGDFQKLYLTETCMSESIYGMFKSLIDFLHAIRSFYFFIVANCCDDLNNCRLSKNIIKSFDMLAVVCNANNTISQNFYGD